MSKDFRGASVWLCLLKSGLFVISADVRVSSWPLMASVWPTIGLTATYLIIVRIGPSVMNCRPHGFEFRWTLFCFNSALVLLNLYIFTEVSLRVAWPLLNTLHWLPVQQRIDYKVALLTFKVRSTSTPSYLHRLLQDREDVHNLRRRLATPALCQPFTKTTIAKRVFRCTAPAIWNSLPKTVLDSDTVTSFKSRLKTHLFSQAFSHTPTYH